MKIKSVFLAAILTAVLCISGNLLAYSGGSGTVEDPYQIAIKTDLLELAAATADYSKYFILTADIDMVGQVFTTAIIAADTIQDYDFQGTVFTGTFDGNGHKITNFTIDGESNDFLGLFGKIDSGGSVKNLSSENCAVSGVSDSYYVGGLVGYNEGGSISNCYSTGTVSGYFYVGGLVGCNYEDGSISNCYSTGTVSGFSPVGGLVGYNYWGSISDCYSTGAVSGVSDSYYVGGLVGANGGSISNCYSTGAVSGSNFVGGLVGYNGGSISNCYSTGTVSGSNWVSGLVGYNSGSVGNSFWDTETSGRATSDGGTGKTTVEMKTLSTFTSPPANWDFTNETTNGTNDYWRMCTEDVDYPRLNWQSTDGDLACPNGVNSEDLNYYVGWWLMNNCTPTNNYCGGADINKTGTVNLEDFAILAAHWLEGI